VVRLEIQDAIVAQPVLREVLLDVIDHAIRDHRAHPVELGRTVDAARTATSTSPSFGVGFATSSNDNTSGEPYR